jgi:23S rRNA pseudouridine1911/1915/1917 synthase
VKHYDITVQQIPDDNRLDKAIPLHLPEVSRSFARKLIEGGSVYLNGKRCSQNARPVRAGDKVRVVIPSEVERPETLLTTKDIVFEDQDLIVINKPAGMPTHATIDSSRHHLVEAVQQFIGARENKKPSEIYLGVHHRLDRDTSGVILFTKRKEANPRIAQAFQNRAVSKEYLAICAGKPKEKSFEIKSFLGTHPKNKRKVASVRSGGKSAETLVTVLETRNLHGKTITLVRAEPKTGRMHQIRVHLAENGLPILGDEMYGVPFPGATRTLLHAFRLSIDEKTFSAPVPEDFQSLEFSPPEE